MLSLPTEHAGVTSPSDTASSATPTISRVGVGRSSGSPQTMTAIPIARALQRSVEPRRTADQFRLGRRDDIGSSSASIGFDFKTHRLDSTARGSRWTSEHCMNPPAFAGCAATGCLARLLQSAEGEGMGSGTVLILTQSSWLQGLDPSGEV